MTYAQSHTNSQNALGYRHILGTRTSKIILFNDTKFYIKYEQLSLPTYMRIVMVHLRPFMESCEACAGGAKEQKIFHHFMVLHGGYQTVLQILTKLWASTTPIKLRLYSSSSGSNSQSTASKYAKEKSRDRERNAHVSPMSQVFPRPH